MECSVRPVLCIYEFSIIKFVKMFPLFKGFEAISKLKPNVNYFRALQIYLVPQELYYSSSDLAIDARYRLSALLPRKSISD